MRVAPGEVNLGKLSELDDVTTGVLRGPLDQRSGRIGSDRKHPGRASSVRQRADCHGFWHGFGGSFALSGRGIERNWRFGIHRIVDRFAVGVCRGKYPTWSRVSLNPSRRSQLRQWRCGVEFRHRALCGFKCNVGRTDYFDAGFDMLTAAMIELSSQHLSSGTARLSGAFVIFIGMGFGVAVGDTVSQAVFGDPQIARAIPLPPWTEPIALIAMPLALDHSAESAFA
jgi:hypothetical protein